MRFFLQQMVSVAEAEHGGINTYVVVEYEFNNKNLKLRRSHRGHACK